MPRSDGKFGGPPLALSETPSGGAGWSSLFYAGFSEVDALDSWLITTGPGQHSCGEWRISSNAAYWPSFSPPYALAGACPGKTSTTLLTESYDLSSPMVVAVRVEFDLRVSSNSPLTVSVTSSTGTVQIGSWQSVEDFFIFDVTPFAAGNSTFQVQVDLQGATMPDFASIDDFRILTFNEFDCATAPLGPPSVPSDSLLIDRSTPDRDLLEVSWDASTCPATDYNLLHGCWCGS